MRYSIPHHFMANVNNDRRTQADSQTANGNYNQKKLKDANSLERKAMIQT